MRIEAFFDQDTSTLTYVVFDEQTKDAVIIDPVLGFDAAAARLSEAPLAKVERLVLEQNLTVRMLLETHAHADHLSGAQVLKGRFPVAPLAIGDGIRAVQEAFKAVFNLAASFPTDGRQFDRLFHDGEVVRAGSLGFEVRKTPGHTPACVSYVFGDAVFTGDALFMPDYGTGRCDFPGGSAADLYQSITTRLYSLPDATRVYVGHDYQPGGRALRYESTVGEQKRQNIQLNAQTSRADFVSYRTERDRSLSAPKLLYPSIQVNIAAGRLPEPEANGVRYLKIPVTC